jgi:hypothetical protein
MGQGTTVPLLPALRQSSRGVEAAQDLDAVSPHSIGGDVSRPRDNELTRAGYATRPAQGRLLGQRGDRLEHAADHEACS